MHFKLFLTNPKVKLLQSLGLKSTLITDGSSPINLFNTAHGLIGGQLPSLSGDNESTLG